MAHGAKNQQQTPQQLTAPRELSNNGCDWLHCSLAHGRHTQMAKSLGERESAVGIITRNNHWLQAAVGG